MKTIGLTGIFGSGKSTVAAFMADKGAAVIDADGVAHQLYKPGAEGWNQVVALFGQGILTEDRQVDRRKLAAVVFNDRTLLKKLNAASHPLVESRIKALLEEYRRNHTPLVVVEAPLLIEAGWEKMVDEVWVVTAPREVIFRRLHRKWGLSYEEVVARIRAQMPVSQQIKHAARVIYTDTSLEHLKAKITRLWPKVAE